MSEFERYQKVTDIVKRHKAMKNKREPWLSHAKEVTRFIVPGRGHYSDGNPTDLRDYEFNNRAKKFLENFAAIFLYGLTNPTRTWFRWILPGDENIRWTPGRRWLERCTTLMHNVLADSRFYNKLHPGYKDFIGFGTGMLGIYADGSPDRYNYPRFDSYQPGEYYIDYDEYDNLSIVHREFYMNAYLVRDRWKDTCSDFVKETAKTDPFKPVKIVHVVEPRTSRDPDKIDKLNMRFASYFWEADKELMLSEGGFNRMPYVIGRWESNSNEVYSYGQGYSALKQAKALNLLEYAITYGINKAMNPPVLLPSDMTKANLGPGGLNYASGNLSEKQVQLMQPMPSDLKSPLLALERWEAIMKEDFMNDLLIYLLDRKNPTATEINSREQEKLLLLAPVIERLQNDVLTPLLDNTFEIMQENDMLPPPPPELADMEVRPLLIGVLAQAQRQSGIESINTITSYAGAVAQFAPEILDKINFDRTIDAMSLSLGTPEGIIRSDDEVAAIRVQRQQQIDEQRQMQEDLQALEGLESASKIAAQPGGGIV